MSSDGHMQGALTATEPTLLTAAYHTSSLGATEWRCRGQPQPTEAQRGSLGIKQSKKGTSCGAAMSSDGHSQGALTATESRSGFLPSTPGQRPAQPHQPTQSPGNARLIPAGAKKSRPAELVSRTALKGRLPTLPLSQYHRRGEV